MMKNMTNMEINQIGTFKKLDDAEEEGEMIYDKNGNKLNGLYRKLENDCQS